MSAWGGWGLKGLGHNIMLTPMLLCQNFYSSITRVTFSGFSDYQNFLPSQIHVTFNQRKSFPVVLTMLLMLTATNAIIIVIMLIKLLVIPTLIILTIMNSVK